jgi:hypothetical protein
MDHHADRDAHHGDGGVPQAGIEPRQPVRRLLREQVRPDVAPERLEGGRGDGTVAEERQVGAGLAEVIKLARAGRAHGDMALDGLALAVVRLAARIQRQQVPDFVTSHNAQLYASGWKSVSAANGLWQG